MSTRPIQHGTYSAYKKRGCRCDACRAANAATHRDYRERRREAGTPYRAPGRQRQPQVQCADCDAMIHPGRCKPGRTPRCKACSHEARRRLRRIRARAERKLAAAREGIASNPRWPFTNGACSHCGEVFTRRGVTAYCSPACRRDARGGDVGNWISRRRRLAIYERDDWTCQLCLEPVDRESDPLDGRYPSLDHIVPQSLTLMPDHSTLNLRTAHRACNTARGADMDWKAA